jgi:hypothetical protein
MGQMGVMAEVLPMFAALAGGPAAHSCHQLLQAGLGLDGMVQGLGQAVMVQV